MNKLSQVFLGVLSLALFFVCAIKPAFAGVSATISPATFPSAGGIIYVSATVAAVGVQSVYAQIIENGTVIAQPSLTNDGAGNVYTGFYSAPADCIQTNSFTAAVMVNYTKGGATITVASGTSVQSSDTTAPVITSATLTPAFPGQRGFVGGSTGDCSVILEGSQSVEAAESLNSTVHGAGRALSQTQARRKINYKTKKVNAPGPVSREMMMEWIGKVDVELRGAGTVESPQAYKRLPDVLSYHAGTIKILHTLTPVRVPMAGENEHDPFKD